MPGACSAPGPTSPPLRTSPLGATSDERWPHYLTDAIEPVLRSKAAGQEEVVMARRYTSGHDDDPTPKNDRLPHRSSATPLAKPPGSVWVV